MTAAADPNQVTIQCQVDCACRTLLHQHATKGDCTTVQHRVTVSDCIYASAGDECIGRLPVSPASLGAAVTRNPWVTAAAPVAVTSHEQCPWLMIDRLPGPACRTPEREAACGTVGMYAHKHTSLGLSLGAPTLSRKGARHWCCWWNDAGEFARAACVKVRRGTHGSICRRYVASCNLHQYPPSTEASSWGGRGYGIGIPAALQSKTVRHTL